MGYSITTRYHGPTNYRGSRVIGTGPALTSDDARDGRYTRATVSYDSGLDTDANHRRAADAVVAKLRAAGWRVSLAADDRGASLPDESGNVYVLRYESDAEMSARIAECDMTDPAQRVTFHRNGVVGELFYTVEFTQGSDQMLGIVSRWSPVPEEQHLFTDPFYAVLDLAHPERAYRGDTFEQELLNAIERAYRHNEMCYGTSEWEAIK